MVKKIVLFLHRWLGLITGLVVFIVSVTGCLFVFQQEITNWTRHDLIYADSQKEATLPVLELQQKTADALGSDHLIYGLTTYKNPDQNWLAFSYKYRGGSWTYMGDIKEYKTAYINPYNGKVAGVVNEKQDFFQIVKAIHWSLLLATPVGQPIVVWCTVIFLFLLVTGFVLWCPRKWNRAGKQKCFRIKWGSTWRRINYDLHNVLGFYFLIITLIIGFTGLFWYFPNFTRKSLHLLGSGSYALPHETAKKVGSTSADIESVNDPMQMAYRTAWDKFPKAYSITFTAPDDSQGTIHAEVKPDGDTYFANSELQFDQYTGKLLESKLYRNKSGGKKLIAMNYDIHVGAIAGLPGKIIAFLASLICASLPVTGFIIWFDRERRKWK